MTGQTKELLDERDNGTALERNAFADSDVRRKHKKWPASAVGALCRTSRS